MAAQLAGGGSKKRFDLNQNRDINVTPFVDVMLVLLIIFMVTAPLATVSIKIDIPFQVKQIKELQNKQQAANQSLFEKVQSGEIDRTEVQGMMAKNNDALKAIATHRAWPGTAKRWSAAWSSTPPYRTRRRADPSCRMRRSS